MAKSLYEGCGSLRAFPYSGRKGRIDGTRELTFPGLPYIVVYRIEDQVVEGCGKSLNRDDSPPQGLKPSLVLHDLRGAKAPLYHSAAGFRDFFRSL